MPRDLSGKETERARERDGLLDRAVDFALDPRHSIDMVFIVGDLFDTHQPSPELAESVMKSLERLVGSGIALITVPGNHDEITYASSVYRIRASRWPGVLVHNPNPQKVVSLAIRGTPLHVYSLAYTGGLTRTRPAIKDFPHTGEPGIHIALFHGSLDWDTGDRSLPLDREALSRSGYSYVALGHIHRFQDHATALAAGRTGHMVYCGATMGKDFGDPGTGMFVVAEVGESVSRVTTQPAGTRDYYATDLDLSGMSSLEEVHGFMGRLAQAHSQSFVRVRLSGQPGFAIDRLEMETRFRDQFHYLEIVGEAIHLSNVDICAWAQEPTIRGEFIRRITEQLSQASSAEEKAILERAMLEGLNALRGRDHR